MERMCSFLLALSAWRNPPPPFRRHQSAFLRPRARCCCTPLLPLHETRPPGELQHGKQQQHWIHPPQLNFCHTTSSPPPQSSTTVRTQPTCITIARIFELESTRRRLNRRFFDDASSDPKLLTLASKMPGGKGKSSGGKSSGGKTSVEGHKKQQSHSARAGLQVR